MCLLLLGKASTNGQTTIDSGRPKPNTTLTLWSFVVGQTQSSRWAYNSTFAIANVAPFRTCRHNHFTHSPILSHSLPYSLFIHSFIFVKMGNKRSEPLFIDFGPDGHKLLNREHHGIMFNIVLYIMEKQIRMEREMQTNGHERQVNVVLWNITILFWKRLLNGKMRTRRALCYCGIHSIYKNVSKFTLSSLQPTSYHIGKTIFDPVNFVFCLNELVSSTELTIGQPTE